MLGKPDSRNLALMCILKRKITLQCIESVEVSFYVNQSMSKVTQAPRGGGGHSWEFLLGARLISKVYTRCQTKTAQKPYPMGPHIPIWLM